MQRTSALTKAFTTNTTESSFASIVPTLTEPVGVNPGESGSGIFNLVPGGYGKVPDAVLCGFFGAGNDNQTFDVRLWGWDRIGSVVVEWIPRPLASFTCTLSGRVGVAGGAIIDTDRFVDTLVVHSIAPQPSYSDLGLNEADALTPVFRGTVRVMSPANDLFAWAVVPLYGCEKLQFDFDMTSATNGNVVFRMFNFED